MKYSISVLGSRRGGWNKAHFEALLKVFEYGVTTCEIGVIYSKGWTLTGIIPYMRMQMLRCSSQVVWMPHHYDEWGSSVIQGKETDIDGSVNSVVRDGSIL